MASSGPSPHGRQDTPPSPIATDRQSQSQARVRRRNRLITSCLECRRRKLKCDKGQPCSNCTKISRPCVFIAPGLDADAQARLTEVKEKMGRLEKSLEEDVARRAIPKDQDTAHYSMLPGQAESYSDQEEEDDTKDLDSTNLAFEDSIYCEDKSEPDDLVDLGIAIGRVRITERIGGLVRPKLSEEFRQALEELPMRNPTHNVSQPALDPSWMAPSKSYVAPSSGFFFAPGVQKSTLMTYLPSKVMVDRLVAHYWVAVHVIARTLHRPSFERRYEKFWTNINAGIEPRNSLQAVVFGVLLNSIVSMPEDTVLIEFGVSKESLINNFRDGAEAALARANFLSTTKLETLQAFVMYLIPQCRMEVSRVHSVLTGSLIRLAECMGLHRDPTLYTSSPIEIHVRRLLWYQICFLDLRTCEAIGPRPQIRPDEYDTQFPVNIDDDDLDRAEQGDFGIDTTKDRATFTDMTLVRMRFETHEMQRLMWMERPKLDQKRPNGKRKVTLTSLLSRIQAFCAAMEKKYLPMLNKDISLHVMAAETYGIVSNRLYIMVLQKYLSNDKDKMPERLRQVVMGACTMILEHSMTIERHPHLAVWSWYLGALHQYHVALVLTNELYAGPREPGMEERVWKGLDFAFNLSSDIPKPEKMRMILEDLVQKTTIYTNIRKARAPSTMPAVGPRTHTPGYELRQSQERETKERDGSQASGATRSASSSAVPSPSQQQSSLYQPQSLPRTKAVGSFPGAIPTVDWGTATGSTLSPNPTQEYAPSENPNPVFATGPGNTTQQLFGNTGSSPAAMMQGSGVNALYSTGQMDVGNDIDWNDFDRMFGVVAKSSTGDMIIPPFTFPQFSGSDLHWSLENGLQ